jgi:hypothetical protein
MAEPNHKIVFTLAWAKQAGCFHLTRITKQEWMKMKSLTHRALF